MVLLVKYLRVSCVRYLKSEQYFTAFLGIKLCKEGAKIV